MAFTRLVDEVLRFRWAEEGVQPLHLGSRNDTHHHDSRPGGIKKPRRFGQSKRLADLKAAALDVADRDAWRNPQRLALADVRADLWWGSPRRLNAGPTALNGCRTGKNG